MGTMKKDRIKLSGVVNNPEQRKDIFQKVEFETGAKLNLVPGEFSDTCKTDTVVKLCGTPEAVEEARDLLISNLKIQSNRIILKMDINHSEHPSLIGKKGSLIQKIMEETQCHIHFPDRNKFSVEEKSNMVSITGEPKNVHRARIMLRALLPFEVFFEVDASEYCKLNPSSPNWKSTDNLEINFTCNATTFCVSIRCSQAVHRQHILERIEFFSGKKGSDLPPVHVKMDIMPQHHNFVKGPNGINIKAITKNTGAKFIFPDALSQDKRSIVIKGNFDCVYNAWHEVMSSLPLLINFDVSETRDPACDYANFLIDHNIQVFSQTKKRFRTQTVTVKGPEKFSKQILQYRQLLLKLPLIKFNPDIEDFNFALSQRSPSDKSLKKNCKIANLSNNLIYLLNISNCMGNLYIESPVSLNTLPSPTVPFSTFSHENYSENEAVICNNMLEETLPSHNDKNRRSLDKLYECALRKANFNQHEVFEKRLSAHQAIHRTIESTQVPSSLYAGWLFSQSMPATSFYKDSDTSNEFLTASLESNSSCSSDDTWDSLVLADRIDEKIWSNNERNIFSRSNVFDFKTSSSLHKDIDDKDMLPKILFEAELYSCLDIFLRQEIDYSAFLLLTMEDLINLGINYQARMKLICLIRELKDAELKKFDGTLEAGRKTVHFSPTLLPGQELNKDAEMKKFDATPGAGKETRDKK